MTGSNSGLEKRVAVVEADVAQLKEDAGETRMLAAHAEGDVSEFKGALRGDALLLQALRETQREHGRLLEAHTRQLDEHSGLLRELGDHVHELDGHVQELDGRVRGLDGRIESLESAVRNGFATVESDMRHGLTTIESDMRSGFATVHGGMTRLAALLERRPEQ